MDSIKKENSPYIDNTTFLRVGGEIYRHCPSPILRRITRMDIAGDYHYPAHDHFDEIELLLCHKGCYTGKLDGVRVDVREGQALIVQKGVKHTDCCSHRSVITSINFLFEGPEKDLLLVRGGLCAKSYRINIKPDDFEPLLLQLERESAAADGCSSFVQDGLIKCILWRIIRSIPFDLLENHWAQLVERESFAERLCSYFETHLLENLTVEEMASDAGMGRRKFEQQCRQIIGESPARAFRRYRMKRACDLLRNPERSISQVSQALGFSDPFQFSRTFKKVFGVSPREKR